MVCLAILHTSGSTDSGGTIVVLDPIFRPLTFPSQELEYDIARQHRVQRNAALIEDREREARLRLHSPAAPLDDELQVAGKSLGPKLQTATDSTSNESHPPADQEAVASLSPFATESSEPQSWTPRARAREQ